MNIQYHAKDFVHLHLHTDYSLLQSTIQIKPLVKHLTEAGMQSCAITDFGNMYGAISFYNYMKAANLHPIIGYEAYLTFGSRFDRNSSVKSGERPYYNIVLLAKDLEGYFNLAYLASKAYTDGLYHKPRIDLEILSAKSKGLIGLSSGFQGAVWHHLKYENDDKALENAKLLESIFGKGNFYIEIQDHNLPEERKIQKNLVALSKKASIQLIATNEAHYLRQEDSRAQEILLCIGEGKTIQDGTRSLLGGQNHFVRSAEEMWNIFGGELPSTLTETWQIAERCQVEFPKEAKLALPDFPIPVNSASLDTNEYFKNVVLEGFESRKNTVWLPLQKQGKLKYSVNDYLERIEREIETIKDMEFPGYFLIVWDFIRFAKSKNIPVGPGRGSAAGSLVAYCLEITDIDPIQYDLLFERFLNPERISMPDIDIDFCVRGRAEVINHVTEFYGRESVCQIITFGTMASKAAIKDVGRALNMPYGDVEKIAKMIPPPVRGRNISISQAIEQVSDLKKAMEFDEKVKDLVELALRLEGCARHSSVHAAGVVISPKALHHLVPVSYSAKNELTSQYSMNDLEKVGMLKMDFLALTTLTIISDCLKSIKLKTGADIEWAKIPLDDQKTLSLFGEGRTEAIFQFESAGMQEICRRLKPKELEDLAALNALYRPGPLDGGMVDDFIARHRGEKRVQYIVPEMKEILGNTYGILVYQEQIMQLAQKLAGYSLGEADMMRRAMGKKKRDEMASHQEKFINGAIDRQIKREKAAEIFNLMAQFADYGFNRSHSVAYAYLAYQTAYLKAHYPTHFYASVLSNESGDTTKILKYSNELRSAGLDFLPPDINESDADFTPLENAVRFGLSAIKGLGGSGIQSIIDARRNGKFTSLFDFTTRLYQGSLNRRGLESLVCGGAFDTLSPEKDTSIFQWRASLFADIDFALSHGQKVWQNKIRGQTELFDSTDTTRIDQKNQIIEVVAWSSSELSRQEKSALGFYLSNHPLNVHKDVLSLLKIVNLSEVESTNTGDKIVLAGIVSGLQIRHSKKGNRFCIFRFEDQSGGVKCLAWAEAFTKNHQILKDDELLIIEGKIESSEGQEITVILDDARRLTDALPLKARRASVKLPTKSLSGELFDDLFRILSRDKGNCEVNLEILLDNKLSLQLLSQPLRIQGSNKLENELIEKGCQVDWIL